MKYPVSGKAILAAAFNKSEGDVPEDIAIDNFEPWDSLGHVMVLLATEEAIGRKLSTEEAIDIVDLASLQSLLNNL